MHPAAGTAAVHILAFTVIYHHSAIAEIVSDINSLERKHILGDIVALEPEIAGYDQIEIGLRFAGRGEVSLYRIHRRTRHCGAHVVCIGHAFVDYPADHAAFYSYAALVAEQQGTGARNGAL